MFKAIVRSGAPRLLVRGPYNHISKTLLSGKQRSTIGGKWVGGVDDRRGWTRGVTCRNAGDDPGHKHHHCRYALDKAPDGAKPGMDGPA